MYESHFTIHRHSPFAHTLTLDPPYSSGAHQCLDIDPKPTLQDLDRFIVKKVVHAGDYYKLALSLGVEPSVILNATKNHPNDCQGALQEVLSEWLKITPGTGRMARTWPSVLEAMESVGRVD